VLLPVDGEVFEITIPSANRLHHRSPATMQMGEKVDLPLHRLRPAVAVIELQRELTTPTGHPYLSPDPTHHEPWDYVA
jgi:hypothetical protein